MSKRRLLTPLAQVLKVLPLLTDSERATLFDLLRPEPAPRKKVSKKVVREKLAEVAKTALCGVCGHTADHPDHDTAYLTSHPFASSAPSARRPSRRPVAQPAPAVSSGDGVENAGAVVADSKAASGD